MDRGQILSLLRALEEADVAYMLIRGLALKLYTMKHGTKRARDQEDASRLARAFHLGPSAEGEDD